MAFEMSSSCLSVLCLCLLAAPINALTLPSLYSPRTGSCPSGPLVRSASGLSSQESAYNSARKPKADAALAAWLSKTNSGFPSTNLPSIGLATSGGGYRSLLAGAGVIQGLDSRDSSAGTAGLFQALSYQSGLSGGSWLLSSLAGNDYPTVSSLKTSLWEPAFQDSLFDPDGLLAGAALAVIANDLAAKDKAGFPPTLTDPWGRLLSYQLLKGFDGGVTNTMSGITSKSSFQNYNVGFPIITSIGVNEPSGQCLPVANSPQYEFSPYETGSWDSGVSAFTPTKYLGTSLNAGNPSSSSSCVTNYDNLGYVLGTSSNLFNLLCSPESSSILPASLPISQIEDFITKIHPIEPTRDFYGVYPNPFYALSSSPAVSSSQSLYLVDGGESQQNNPIWPFLQPARSSALQVLLVNDNSADVNNLPNGTGIYNTYQVATAAGLTRMPVIPSPDVFVAKGYNKSPVFFGCNDPNVLTIVYIPNAVYSDQSAGEPTFKLQYSDNDSDSEIANGVQVVTKGGDAQWPTCLACAITKKQGSQLPAACAACFTQYCYTS